MVAVGLEPTCIQLPFQQFRRLRGYTTMANCSNCGNSTKNPKYCSRRCSTIQNNKQYPKRSPEGKCKCCRKKIKTIHVYCRKCRDTWRKARSPDVTLAEAIYENHHKSSAFALVRTRARAVAKRLGLTRCKICSYDKHVEICHITQISSFPVHTKISVINDPVNLMPLCPNHHWEFDYGVLVIPRGLIRSGLPA